MDWHSIPDEPAIIHSNERGPTMVSLFKDYAPVYTPPVNLRKDSDFQQYLYRYVVNGRAAFENNSRNPMVLNPVPVTVYRSWGMPYKPLIPAHLLPLGIQMAEIYAELTD